MYIFILILNRHFFKIDDMEKIDLFFKIKDINKGANTFARKSFCFK